MRKHLVTNVVGSKCEHSLSVPNSSLGKGGGKVIGTMFRIIAEDAEIVHPNFALVSNVGAVLINNCQSLLRHSTLLGALYSFPGVIMTLTLGNGYPYYLHVKKWGN